MQLFTAGIELTPGAQQQHGREPACALREEASLPQESIVITIDCRGFYDPQVSDRRKHIGTFPDTVREFVAHESFPRWLTKAQEAILSVRARASTINVITYCKKGRHRSVAGAAILQHCLQETGYDVVRMSHLHCRFWHP